ncbi:unnamed protein product, partial [Rotaria magnacalcarata]
MNRSKYCYEYNTSMRRFASSVYALGGRNIYQFLQLNLPGAFPTIPTLYSYNKELCKRFQEGEFQDCTGVIANVYYNAESNSFVGFCPTLNNGLPTIRQYQTDDFFQLEDWFDSDSTHVGTKLRNRLLTHSTSLMMGSFPISIQDIESLIHNYSKIEHNLVVSDIY